MATLRRVVFDNRARSVSSDAGIATETTPICRTIGRVETGGNGAGKTPFISTMAPWPGGERPGGFNQFLRTTRYVCLLASLVGLVSSVEQYVYAFTCITLT